MEIVVSDTQILIDMHSAGLLELVSKSAMHFHTVDYVIAELNRSPYQRPIIGQMVSDGSLKVYSYDAKDNALLLEFFENYSCKTNLSITDCAVLKYAKDNGYRMLTGDRKLRNCAENEGVIVSGILYVADKFVEEGIESGSDMAGRLEHLLDVNPRLPKKDFLDRRKAMRGFGNLAR